MDLELVESPSERQVSLNKKKIHDLLLTSSISYFTHVNERPRSLLQVTIHLRDDINPVKVLTHRNHDVGNANRILVGLQKMWVHGFPLVEDLRPFDFKISPNER